MSVNHFPVPCLEVHNKGLTMCVHVSVENERTLRLTTFKIYLRILSKLQRFSGFPGSALGNIASLKCEHQSIDVRYEQWCGKEQHTRRISKSFNTPLLIFSCIK